jgi:hypothetical protein
MKRTLAAAAGALAMTGGAAFMAAPAQAQPVISGGLVNVQVTNVLNDNQVAVQIPITAAANICVGDVTVGVIAEIVDEGGTFQCDAKSGKQTLEVTR